MGSAPARSSVMNGTFLSCHGLAALAGAEVLLVPVACSSEPTRRVFQIELQAHAVTNGMYVVCANRIGAEGEKRTTG